MFKRSTKKIPAVRQVELKKYLGTWYEIARFPHAFEKGLDNVTATYTLRKDGKIEVVNSGYKKGKKKSVKGTAWIPDPASPGNLLVSFFRFFKSTYKIIRLDENRYQYAVVAGGTMDYLWILCRKPAMSDELYHELLAFAAENGFDIRKILRVPQGRKSSARQVIGKLLKRSKV